MIWVVLICFLLTWSLLIAVICGLSNVHDTLALQSADLASLKMPRRSDDLLEQMAAARAKAYQSRIKSNPSPAAGPLE